MYRLTFEYGHKNPSPRYLDVSSRLAYAENWSEALRNARRVAGKTTKANLATERDPSVAERRRNKRYIVTIRDIGVSEIPSKRRRR